MGRRISERLGMGWDNSVGNGAGNAVGDRRSRRFEKVRKGSKRLLEVGWMEEMASDYQAGDSQPSPGCQPGDEEGKKEWNGMEWN